MKDSVILKCIDISSVKRMTGFIGKILDWMNLEILSVFESFKALIIFLFKFVDGMGGNPAQCAHQFVFGSLQAVINGFFSLALYNSLPINQWESLQALSFWSHWFYWSDRVSKLLFFYFCWFSRFNFGFLRFYLLLRLDADLRLFHAS